MTTLDYVIKDLYEAEEEIERLRVELEKNSKELETYKKALDYLDNCISVGCENSYTCDVYCEHSECIKKDMRGRWSKLALQKARAGA